MKTFLRILKISFSVLGSLLLILLLFPVRLDLLWQDAVLTADMKYMFFRRRLSSKERTDRKEKQKKEQEEEKETEKEKEKEKDTSASDAGSETEVSGGSGPVSAEGKKPEKKKKEKEKEETTLSEKIEKVMRFVEPLFRPGYWLVRMLLKAVRVRDVSVVVSVTGEDPASVGFRSGIHWSLIGNLMKTLNYLFGKNVTYGEVTVYPCFGDAEPKKEKISCSVSVQPLIVILLVLGFLLGYLFELVRNLLKRGGKKNVK